MRTLALYAAMLALGQNGQAPPKTNPPPASQNKNTCAPQNDGEKLKSPRPGKSDDSLTPEGDKLKSDDKLKDGCPSRSEPKKPIPHPDFGF